MVASPGRESPLARELATCRILAVALAAAGVVVVPPVAAQPAATIVASRMLGGHWDDVVDEIARAADGRLYVRGRQASPFAPDVASSATVNAGQSSVFVARVDPATLAVDWRVHVGRDRASVPEEDHARRVEGFALGPDGHAYVAAYASSSRPPAAGDTYTGDGGVPAIFRVDPNGTATLHAGPLDPAIRSVRALAVDGHGHVYLTGRASRSLPTSPGAMVSGAQLGAHETGAYLMRIDAATRAVGVATFLGVPGSRAATPNAQSCRAPFVDAHTVAHAIAVAPDGTIYLAGQAEPGDLAATPGAATTPDVAYRDAFVMRVDAAGTSRLFVARFGGGDNDRATALLLEPGGSALVAGKWLDRGGVWHGPRAGFQTTIARQWSASNPCEPTVPTEAAFLLRVGPDGAQLGGTSLIGSVGGDLAGWMNREGVMPVRLAGDGAGHVLLAGTTDSGQSLPTRAPFVPDADLFQASPRPAHAFVMKVRASDFALVYASRFGPRGSDAHGRGVAADGAGNVYVVGTAPNAEAFPLVHAAPSGRPFRFASTFVTRLHEAAADFALAAAPAAGTGVQLTATLADPYATGHVEFRDRGTPLATAPLVDGKARVAVPLPAGIRVLSAVVRGAGAWDGNATAPLALAVAQPGAAP